MSTAQTHHIQTHPRERFHDQHLSSEWWKANDLGKQGNKMIAAVSERLLSPAWECLRGYTGFFGLLCHVLKNGHIELIGWGFWAFLGPSVVRNVGQGNKAAERSLLSLPVSWRGRRGNGTPLFTAEHWVGCHSSVSKPAHPPWKEEMGNLWLRGNMSATCEKPLGKATFNMLPCSCLCWNSQSRLNSLSLLVKVSQMKRHNFKNYFNAVFSKKKKSLPPSTSQQV